MLASRFLAIWSTRDKWTPCWRCWGWGRGSTWHQAGWTPCSSGRPSSSPALLILLLLLLSQLVPQSSVHRPTRHLVTTSRRASKPPTMLKVRRTKSWLSDTAGHCHSFDYYYFLTRVLSSQGMKKITLCNARKSTEIKLEWTLFLLLLHKTVT